MNDKLIKLYDAHAAKKLELKRISAEINELKRQIFVNRTGVDVGAIVYCVLAKRPYKVCKIDPTYVPPSLIGYPLKRNGAWGKQECRLSSEWRLLHAKDSEGDTKLVQDS